VKDWRIYARPDIYLNKDIDKLFMQIAKKFIETGMDYQKANGSFVVALGGGRTPKRMNQKIAELSNYYNLDWSRVFLFFSDERCVTKEHDCSNFKMIYETLVKPLSIPLQNVFRIQGELGADAAAANYEKDIISFFRNSMKKTFDLALLGLGKDCHTASLFPGASALKEKHRLIVPGGKGEEGLERVTMSYPLINSSSNIWFLICGEEKRRAFNELLNGEYNPYCNPAQGVFCKNGDMVYFTDIEM